MKKRRLTQSLGRCWMALAWVAFAMATGCSACHIAAADSGAAATSPGDNVYKGLPPPPGPTPQEIEMGDKSVAELERNPKFKLLNGNKSPEAKALLAKLNGMADELGKASLRPLIKYTVKVVKDKDINAFTLPNGHIYMTQGLLDFTASDDEIAAVLAHEIGHTAKMHALRGEAKAKKLTLASLAGLAAMLIGHGSGADIGVFSQYVLMGIMNGYGEGYEEEADSAAISELVKTQYNPSAMVTFMQRLNEEEKTHPTVELGIFRTHPPSDERAAAALAAIRARGLPFNPRAVSGGKQATVKEGTDRISVQFGDTTLLEFALPAPPSLSQSVSMSPSPSLPSSSNPSSTDRQSDAEPLVKARAQAVAQHINQLLRDGLKMHEVRAVDDSMGARLLARDSEIARVLPADARLQNLTPLACAEKWRDNFRRLFWNEELKGKF